MIATATVPGLFAIISDLRFRHTTARDPFSGCRPKAQASLKSVTWRRFLSFGGRRDNRGQGKRLYNSGVKGVMVRLKGRRTGVKPKRPEPAENVGIGRLTAALQ